MAEYGQLSLCFENFEVERKKENDWNFYKSGAPLVIKDNFILDSLSWTTYPRQLIVDNLSSKRSPYFLLADGRVDWRRIL